ncbi:MAG: histidinol-phosphate transaminase [Coriobacteriaceae bacterium]|nr:histidinol-phosphate transaminase [Coriobacteriaceae bacterium]
MDNVRFNPRLADIVPYDPKYLPAEHMISANESPYNVPDEIRYEVRKRLKRLDYNRYPDPLANELRDIIADANGLERENVLVGNGGDELLFNTALAFGGPGRTFLNCPPTFSVYEANAELTGTAVVNIPRLPNYRIDEMAVLTRVAKGDIDFIILTSPNNPTGQLVSDTFIRHLLESTDALVMVDEAYGEFSRATCRPLLQGHKNLVILRTFSKAFSCAGVRLGYLLGDAEVISEYLKVRQPYSVDAVSQLIGCTVYENRQLFAPAITSIIMQREHLMEELEATEGVHVYPSDANFILLQMERADEAWEKLYEQGVLVRDFSHTPMLEDCLRVSVGTEKDNKALVKGLRKIMRERRRESAEIVE